MLGFGALRGIFGKEHSNESVISLKQTEVCVLQTSVGEVKIFIIVTQKICTLFSFAVISN